MSYSAKNYLGLLKSLLPRGRFWNRDDGSVLTQVLYGKAEELSRVDFRSDDLINESFTTKADELLEEHEIDFGVDTEDIEIASTVAQRREVIHAKKVEVGQQDKGYFEDIASALDYTIHIEESIPARVGIVAVGEAVGSAKLIYKWIVYVHIDGLVESRQVNLTRLINEIAIRKPAHTMVFFLFYGTGFGRCFGKGFDRIPHYDNSWPELEFGRCFSDGFANAYDYDAVYLTGGFNSGFGTCFDAYHGGCFDFDEFGDGFFKPS